MEAVPGERVVAARELRDRALALAAAGDAAGAAAAWERLIARFEGDGDEDVRWLLADAYVQRADLARRAGDATTALAVRHRGEQRVGALIRLDEAASEREYEAAVELVDAGAHAEAADRLRRVTCGYDGGDAGPEAIHAHGQGAVELLEAGAPVAVALHVVDAWLEEAGDAADPERRAAFGWLHARRGWANHLAERYRDAVADADAGLAYLGDDEDDADVREVVEWLEEERLVWLEQVAYDDAEEARELLDEGGSLRAAEAAARRAADAGNAYGQLLLGIVLEMQPGRGAEARGAFRAATAAHDEETAAFASMRLGIHYDFDVGDAAAALEQYERAFATGDSHVRRVVGSCLTLLLVRAGDRREAERVFTAVAAPSWERFPFRTTPEEGAEAAVGFVGALHRRRVWQAARALMAYKHRRRRRRDAAEHRHRG